MERTRLPLEGIRVADFSWVIVAPYCTQFLAMMGAEVIRIESSLRIDISRRQPPYADGVSGIDRSGLFNNLNMGKKSCTLNLAKPKAIELAKRLVKTSGIVVEQSRYGVMEQLGLGYDVLRQIKPNIIFVSSSGLGRTGPECNFSAYNESFLAYSGIASMTGYRGGPPVLTGGIFADHETGTNLTLAILAALFNHTRSGQGAFIDDSMVESLAAQIPEAIIDYQMNGRIAQRDGNRDPVMAPHGCYPCIERDQWVAIAVSSEAEWQAFCHAVGHIDWKDDTRFKDLASRKQNEDELDKLVSGWTRTHTKSEVTDVLQRASVPSGPVLDIAEVVNDTHLNERGFFVTTDHPEAGKRIDAGVPWKLSAYQAKVAPAPMLGQDNYYVFCELLGLSDEEFANMIAEEVIL